MDLQSLSDMAIIAAEFGDFVKPTVWIKISLRSAWLLLQGSVDSNPEFARARREGQSDHLDSGASSP